MKENANGFSVSAAALSILTAALADASVPAGSARAALLSGALSTLLLSTAARLTAQKGRQPVLALLLSPIILLELFRMLLQAQAVCGREFRSMALVGLLPLLLLAGWQVRPEQWNAVARVLWWLVLLGGAVYLTGIAGQLRWMRLVESDFGLPARQMPVLFYAEFLLFPLLCPGQRDRRAACLPWLTFGVQAAVLLGMRMLFGTRDYPVQQLLCVWSTGTFSRMDALLLLVWLACAFYRAGVLCTVLRLCLPTPAQKGAVK